MDQSQAFATWVQQLKTIAGAHGMALTDEQLNRLIREPDKMAQLAMKIGMDPPPGVTQPGSLEGIKPTPQSSSAEVIPSQGAAKAQSQTYGPTSVWDWIKSLPFGDKGIDYAQRPPAPGQVPAPITQAPVPVPPPPPQVVNSSPFNANMPTGMATAAPAIPPPPVGLPGAGGIGGDGKFPVGGGGGASGIGAALASPQGQAAMSALSGIVAPKNPELPPAPPAPHGGQPVESTGGLPQLMAMLGIKNDKNLTLKQAISGG